MMIRDPFRRSQLAIAALFCFLGFQYGTWVSRVPQIRTHLGLNAAEVGLLLLAPGIGAAVSFPLVTRLMRTLGSTRLAEVSGQFHQRAEDRPQLQHPSGLQVLQHRGAEGAEPAGDGDPGLLKR